jgi:hypothetical protein
LTASEAASPNRRDKALGKLVDMLKKPGQRAAAPAKPFRKQS